METNDNIKSAAKEAVVYAREIIRAAESLVSQKPFTQGANSKELADLACSLVCASMISDSLLEIIDAPLGAAETWASQDMFDEGLGPSSEELDAIERSPEDLQDLDIQELMSEMDDEFLSE